ncbi:Na-translocating system protein MpsC family protein [Planococcus sp. N028]|uniref:Na-translocating system protein MpsC family protein n=1 Tax=Planococcus shixiaomingii TaxID=3058393 RepID=A0ABT8N300_9BACL|nr:Na-translocating system protein MpsC family protein [Planococcus sp. N028]MDN7242032.1 Na-translocating system protein MpsC family protein [Planococcus sp. N028]
MPKEKTIHTEIGSYISALLRDHFGKGPTSVYVAFARPFITVHLRGFLTPTEKVLLKQNEPNRVLKIRDLLMSDLIPEIKLGLWKIGELDVKEVYADWNLDHKSGMIIAVLNEEVDQGTFEWPKEVDENAFQEELVKASVKAQKAPGTTEIYWLNDRIILAKRTEILVAVEKELIKNGFGEELRIAKRPLERKVLAEVQLEATLKRKIIETFVEWNFETDKAYTAFILEPKK